MSITHLDKRARSAVHLYDLLSLNKVGGVTVAVDSAHVEARARSEARPTRDERVLTSATFNLALARSNDCIGRGQEKKHSR